jgi:hypothetical protein
MATAPTEQKKDRLRNKLRRRGYRPVPEGRDVHSRGVPDAEVWYATPEIAEMHMQGRQAAAAERLERLNIGNIEGIAPGARNPSSVIASAGEDRIKPEFRTRMRGQMAAKMEAARESQRKAAAGGNITEV